MAQFLIAYKKTSIAEGGYANVKGDNGGETYAGISRVFHPTWEGWSIVDRNKPLERNDHIKDDKLEPLIKKFYKTNFWDVIGGDEIEDQYIANTIYDFGVNSGHKTSIKNIQRVLDLPETGKITKDLITKINNP